MSPFFDFMSMAVIHIDALLYAVERSLSTCVQWRRKEFSFGAIAQMSEGRKSLVRSRGEAWQQGLEDEVPRKLKQFDTLFADFDCRNDQNLKNFAQLTS